MTGQRRHQLLDFEESALPHLDDVYRTAVRLVWDRGEARDVVQNVYLQAWKCFHRFRPGTNCRAWLFRILFNEIRHYRRRKGRERLAPAPEGMLEESLVYEAPVPEQLRDREVLAALARVPAEFREVILLVDVHEFTYREAAEALSVPIGTVMSRLSRARRLLRRHLAALAESYGYGERAGEAEER